MSFEDRLRDSFHRASDSMPDTRVPWEPTITKARRARTNRISLMAAAAVLALGGVAWAATTLGGSTEQGPPPPAGDPTPETTPEQEATPEETEESRAVRTRVLDWVKALSIGDQDTAWKWLSPRTQAYFDNDIENFKQMTGLSEGFGSWYTSDPPPQTTWRVLASSGDGVAGVVEIHGQVTKEGSEELGHDALPIRIVDGEVLVEPFSSDVPLTPKEPSPNESYPMDDLPALFSVTGVGEVHQVNFFYDGLEADMSHSISEGRGKSFEASADAPHGIGPGPHFVTVAAVDDTGGIAVLVVPFFVE